MLGDAGANVLGGVLGLNLVLNAPALWQLLYFTVLVLIHLLTEKISLSRLIAENNFLSLLDQLGRTESKK
jgi:hypothetical protein